MRPRHATAAGWRAAVQALLCALVACLFLPTPNCRAVDLAQAGFALPFVRAGAAGWEPDLCELEPPEADDFDPWEPALNWPVGAEADEVLAGPSSGQLSGPGSQSGHQSPSPTGPRPGDGAGWLPPDSLPTLGDPHDPGESGDIVPVAAGPADFLPPQEPPSPLWLVPLDPPWWPDDAPAGHWSIPAAQPLTGWNGEGGAFDSEADWIESGEHTSDEGGRLPWGARVLRRFSGLFDEWTSRIALGGRSLAGNSNQNFVDLLADFENKTSLRSTQVNLGGQFGESNDRVVANRWFANSTTDFYHGPRWLTFTKMMDQYDALQNLDYRGTFSAGLGYRFLFDDQRRIIARVGPGVTLEVFHDPADSRVTPDAFGELEVRLPLWQRLKWEQKTTVFPSLHELEIARVQNTTALMYAFDERERWSLRVGFNYQYIGQPNVGKLPSDFTTNVSVMYQRK